MGFYVFSDPGPETASLGPGDVAIVVNLDNFNKTDTVTGAGDNKISIGITGHLALDLTGYDGISGFASIETQATDGIDLTIGQDFYDANNAAGKLTVTGGDTGGTVVRLNAGGLDADTSVDLVSHSAANDVLTGGAGNDALLGNAGGDTLRGGAGADALDGGDGSDFANYQGSSAAVTVDLLTGATSGGDAASDTLTSIENLYGSSNDDHLSGDNARNIIGGELGDDTIVGNGGDDSLSGEGGNDSLDGGDGNDRLVGGDGVDTIQGGTGNDSVDAGTGDDIVFGQEGDDAIVGGIGDDQIAGEDGNDIIEGGAGADTINGNAGIDTLSYAGSAEGVTVNLATGAASGGEAQGDAFAGIEQVLGSGSNDTLTGDGGANTLWGLAGNDVLRGGAGGDLLKGGAGSDRFVYTALSDSAVSGIGKDVIADFTAGDRIDLSAIDADGNAGNGDTAFSFGTGGFTGHAGELRVVTAGAIQVVYVDANGDKAPDFAINVIADHPLTAADFVL